MLLTLLLLLLPTCRPMVLSGTYNNLYLSWDFLARFCFKGGRGATMTSSERKWTYEIEFAAAACCPTLNLYYDSPSQWASVYGSELSCREKEDQARGSIRLIAGYGTCTYKSSSDTYTCRGVRFIEGTRARWWYIAISNCDQFHNYQLNYTLTFTNGDHFNDKHFSADELGIMEMTIISAVVMSLIVALTTLYAHALRSRRLYHATFKTYQASVCLYLAHCTFAAVYKSLYATNGEAPRALWLVSQVCLIGSTSSFLGLLLALSNGYTIVSATLTVCGFGALLTFTGFFFLFMSVCLIWEQTFDPAEVLYTYQSPPGYLLIAIYLPAWAYFLLNCTSTAVKFKRKRKFYTSLGMFYSIWLLAIPVTILIGNQTLPDWTRLKTVTILQQIVWLISYIYLLVIFAPTHSNKHFPFHLRAAKVGLGSETEDRRADHNYDVELESVESVGRERGTPVWMEKSEVGEGEEEVEMPPTFIDIFTVS